MISPMMRDEADKMVLQTDSITVDEDDDFLPFKSDKEKATRNQFKTDTKANEIDAVIVEKNKSSLTQKKNKRR